MEGGSLNIDGLAAALAGLEKMAIEPEVQYHTAQQPEGKDVYRRNLTQSFLYKFFLSLVRQQRFSLRLSFLACSSP